MQFDPTIHTKEFLLSNPDVVFALASRSAEFARSDLANDFEILKIAYETDWTVAHRLALYQSEWIHSEAAKSFEILQLADDDGETVAHWLARHQPEWVHSEAAKSFEISKLTDDEGKTVAHKLARHQSEWIYSEAAKSFEILKLANINGWTVAHELVVSQSEWIHSEAAKNTEILKLAENKGQTVALLLVRHNEKCINHEPLLQKQVLILEYHGKSLAEEISQKYKSKGFDVPDMAIKLISQGAAYKHSEPIDFGVGEIILNHSKTLIEDSSEQLIALKQLQALYSTFSHNVSKIISTQEQKYLQKWQGLLLQSENMIRQHFDRHPDLYDIEHTVDIHCEPADDLLKKFKSEIDLRKGLGCLSELSGDLSQESSIKAQICY